jgi:hypothetical protein
MILKIHISQPAVGNSITLSAGLPGFWPLKYEMNLAGGPAFAGKTKW